MSWVANDPAASTPTKKEEDIKMEDAQERNGNGVRGGGGGEREVDFDVAEEDDFDVAS